MSYDGYYRHDLPSNNIRLGFMLKKPYLMSQAWTGRRSPNKLLGLKRLVAAAGTERIKHYEFEGQ